MKPSSKNCTGCGAKDMCPVAMGISTDGDINTTMLTVTARGDRDLLIKLAKHISKFVEKHKKNIPDAEISVKGVEKKTISRPKIIAIGSIDDLPDDLPVEVKDFLKMFMGRLDVGLFDDLEILDLKEEPNKEKEKARAEEWR